MLSNLFTQWEAKGDVLVEEPYMLGLYGRKGGALGGLMHLTEWILMAFDFGNLLGFSVIWLTVKWCCGTLHLGSDKNETC